MQVEILIETDGWKGLEDACALLTVAAEGAYRHAGGTRSDCDVAIVLTDDEAVAQLNARWRHKPVATNVLSFPASPVPDISPGPPHHLGDIVLASGVVAREAAEQGKAMSTHVSHLVVHAMLHLMGHDHDCGTRAEAMETLEKQIMADLGLPDPYAS